MYNGTCYIGVVGPDTIPAAAILSIMNITRRPGDAPPELRMATKGYEARQMHIQRFLETGHDWILMLDHDMLFEPDTLERLRSHGLPYVSGLYMRRRHNPILPVWFQPYDGTFPFRRFTAVPERGRLHPIGASGWGCILIHREVIEKTRPILKGEWEVIEDDMDVWPYDLDAVLAGREQIRPLTRRSQPVGSDVRYPFYALQAGYQLMGDPDVRPAHILDYPLSPDDYEGIPAESRDAVAGHIHALESDRRVYVNGVAP